MSAKEFELNCTVRTDLGKGASRRLRRLDNNIPAVLYGGSEDPVSLTIAHKTSLMLLRTKLSFHTSSL